MSWKASNYHYFVISVIMPSTKKLAALSRPALKVTFESSGTHLMWCKLTALLLLVPVHDTTHKGRNQTGTGIGTSSSLHIPNVRFFLELFPFALRLQQNMAAKLRA